MPNFQGQLVAADQFDRTVTSGWGTATTGGAWTVTAPNAFSTKSDGLIRNDSGRESFASLGLSVADTQASTVFTIPALPASGNGVYLALEMRKQSSGDAYRVRVRVGVNGKVTLVTSRVVNRSEVLLNAETLVTSSTTPGQAITVDAFVAGKGTVTVGSRAWTSGVTPPEWRTVKTTDSSVTPSGKIGYRIYTSSGTGASNVAIRSFKAWALTPATTAEAPPVVPPPAVPPPASPAVGALPVGGASYAAPSNALYVSTGGSNSNSGSAGAPMRSVQAAVDKSSAGQVIVVRGGTYNESISVPSSKTLTIQPYPGEAVWFDGSVPVTSWTKSGTTWVSKNWTAQFDRSASFTRGSNSGNFIGAQNPLAAYPDQVFIGSKQLVQVPAGTVPATGQFAVDYSAKTLTIGSDPAAGAVRGSTLERAFVIAGKLTLRGVGVRRYATPLPQMGAVYVAGVGGSVLENVVLQENATQAVSVTADNVTLRNLTVTNNGMTGVHAHGANNFALNNSVIRDNNTQQFNRNPATSGVKVTESTGVTISGNTVTEASNGIWLDTTVIRFTIAMNTVAGATQYGILAEAAETGIVAGNRVSGAQYGFTAFDSGHVKVYNNYFENNRTWDVGVSQDERRNKSSATKAACPWISNTITIVNNIFDNKGAIAAGSTANAGYQVYALDKATNIPADAMNLTITGNLFTGDKADSSTRMTGWGGSKLVLEKTFAKPADLAASKNSTWRNAINPPTTSLTTAAASSSIVASIAVALPADIAAALGLPTGTKRLGP